MEPTRLPELIERLRSAPTDANGVATAILTEADIPVLVSTMIGQQKRVREMLSDLDAKDARIAELEEQIERDEEAFASASETAQKACGLLNGVIPLPVGGYGENYTRAIQDLIKRIVELETALERWWVKGATKRKEPEQ